MSSNPSATTTTAGEAGVYNSISNGVQQPSLTEVSQQSPSQEQLQHQQLQSFQQPPDTNGFQLQPSQQQQLEQRALPLTATREAFTPTGSVHSSTSNEQHLSNLQPPQQMMEPQRPLYTTSTGQQVELNLGQWQSQSSGESKIHQQLLQGSHIASQFAQHRQLSSTVEGQAALSLPTMHFIQNQQPLQQPQQQIYSSSVCPVNPQFSIPSPGQFIGGSQQPFQIGSAT
jgi:hypothetical protein